MIVGAPKMPTWIVRSTSALSRSLTRVAVARRECVGIDARFACNVAETAASEYRGRHEKGAYNA